MQIKYLSNNISNIRTLQMQYTYVKCPAAGTIELQQFYFPLFPQTFRIFDQVPAISIRKTRGETPPWAYTTGELPPRN